MKRQLKTVVNVLTKHMECRNELRNYLIQVLIKSDNLRTYLEESDAIEIHINGIVVSFCWDNITAFNETTNACIDVISGATTDEVVDFFEEVGFEIPVCPL